MPNMTFLYVPDGSLNARDTTGPVTGTATSPTYSAGYWAGHTGVNVPVTFASAANAGLPLLGSMVVRFRRNGVGVVNNIAGFATAAQIPAVWLRAGDDNKLTTYLNPTTTPAWPLTPTTVLAAIDTFVYFEWSGAAVNIVHNGNAKTLGTRGIPPATWVGGSAFTVGGAPGHNALGGRLDGIAVYDGLLTDAEHQYLRSVTEPWTWDMDLSAPYAGYIDVLPSPGVNTEAPSLDVT